jgi:uncharacterized protein with HEPN domain
MARRAEEYLSDLLESVAAVRAYTRSGRSAFLRSAMARDAVVARIIQIGEAVKGAQGAGIDLEALAPEIPWKQIAGMRDLLSHQYWRTDPLILWAVVAKDLKPMEAAVRKSRAARRTPKRKG